MFPEIWIKCPHYEGPEVASSKARVRISAGLRESLVMTRRRPLMVGRQLPSEAAEALRLPLSPSGAGMSLGIYAPCQRQMRERHHLTTALLTSKAPTALTALPASVGYSPATVV